MFVLDLFLWYNVGKVESFEMSKRSGLFVVAILSVWVFGANAAPSVKVLGAKKTGDTNSALTLNSQTAKKNVPVARIGSVKASNLQTAKSVKKTGTGQVGGTTGAATNRLSVGKYIHSGGVQSGSIKTTVPSVAMPSSDDFLSLKDKVQQLEAEVALKQNALQAGDGVVIEDNVLSLSQDVDGLVDNVADLQQQMAGKADLLNVTNNYYTKAEIADILDAYDVQNTKTVWNAEKNRYEYVTFVNEFDDEIFEE